MTSSLEDKEAIRELLSEYCHYVDKGEFEKWENLWMEDAVLLTPEKVSIDGKKAIGETIRAAADQILGKVKHMTTNEMIKVSGNNASVESTILVLSLDDNNTISIMLAGTYIDKLQKVDDNWKFRERAVEVLANNNDAAIRLQPN